MFTNNKNYTSAILALSLVLCSSQMARAESDMSSVESIPEAAASPASNNVPIFSGGIGDDEIDYIHSVQNQYNVKLLFTEANGMYLSDLTVSIRDRQGRTVVSTVTKGPVVLVDLPNGSYSVTASQGDTMREQKISLVGGHTMHTYQFRFPTRDIISSKGDSY